ncbi:MAG: hypothetical protein M3547_03510 [Acidobacteriota bacterium]|nr:hypothetical protein [Acidobacteriota bacterium]
MAKRFGTSSSAMFRHQESHVSARLLKAQKIAEVSKADHLVEQVEELKRKAQQILQKAEASGELRAALAGVRELSRLIELVAKLTGELKTNQVNIFNVETLDPATLQKMAEVYLERHRKELP